MLRESIAVVLCLVLIVGVISPRTIFGPWDPIIGWVVGKVLEYTYNKLTEPMPPGNAAGVQGPLGGGGGDAFGPAPSPEPGQMKTQ